MLIIAIRSLLLLGAFYLLTDYFDILDTFFYQNIPGSLAISFLLVRLFFSTLLLFPLLDLLGISTYTTSKITKWLAIIFVLLLTVNISPSGTFYFRGSNVNQIWIFLFFFTVAIILTIPVSPIKWKLPKWVYAPAIILAIALPNILSPPDLLPFFQKADKTGNLDEAFFYEWIKNDSLPDGEIENRLVVFISANCKYCRFTMHKVNNTVAKTPLKYSDVLVVFAGTFKDPEAYFNLQKLRVFPHIQLPPQTVFSMSESKSVPVILQTKAGKVVNTFNFRSFDDRKIIKTLLL